MMPSPELAANSELQHVQLYGMEYMLEKPGKLFMDLQISTEESFKLIYYTGTISKV